MNYVDYIRHALYTPDTYHRRFDFDLPPIGETAKRIALASLPFIGLYRPAGVVLSIGMGGARTFTHLQNSILAEGRAEWKLCALEAGKAALSALSLAVAVFHSASALFITTGFDGMQGLAVAVQSLKEGEYSKAGEEALQAAASAAYLTFMATGALEAMLLFALIQAAVSLYQAGREMKEGRYIEGVAKLGMAVIRLGQARGYAQQIQRRNALLEMQRIRAVFLRVLRGREAGHLVRHPLSSLKSRIEAKEVVLLDGKGEEVHFGSHFHGNGGTLVKGENLIFRTKVIDGKEVTELDFKVNHAFRAHLDEVIQDLKNVRSKEMAEVLALSGSHAKGITVSKGSFSSGASNSFFDPGAAHQIQVQGLGSILIGADQETPNLYDRVVVRLDADQTLFELHEMLSLVDLDRAIQLSTQDDLERLKMGHLFRTFFPREATPFERTEEFFSLSTEQLKAKMVEKSPEMKQIFETYYPKMQEEHLFDGRVRYRIAGLSEEAYAQGARALTAAVTGAYKDEELFSRVASMLRMGMIATEVRDANEMGKQGLGGGIDYMSGGADSVYTQLLTEKNCQEQMDLNSLYYYSKVRLLIGLEALETGTYQYHTDALGNRIYEEGRPFWWFDSSYAERDGILEFIQKEQAMPGVRGDHEVMLKERVAPSFFKGLIVPDEKTKADLIAYLRKSDLLQGDEILNTPVDRFIRVGTNVTEELIGV
jgi:hypothetical protein